MIPPAAKSPGRGKAAALLAAVYVAGIVTGVGGGFLFVRYEVRGALTAAADQPAPVDRYLSRMEVEISRDAGLTPAERAALQERMKVLAVRFKDSRTQFVSELREAVQHEAETVAGRVDPTRRERVRDAIRHRLERWGLERRAPATPRPTESL
jgi:hypothetical protein